MVQSLLFSLGIFQSRVGVKPECSTWTQEAPEENMFIHFSILTDPADICGWNTSTTQIQSQPVVDFLSLSRVLLQISWFRPSQSLTWRRVSTWGRSCSRWAGRTSCRTRWRPTRAKWVYCLYVAQLDTITRSCRVFISSPVCQSHSPDTGPEF